MLRRTLAALTGAALAVTLTAAPAAAGRRAAFPATVDLPAGWQPEGIAIGRAPYAFFGSRLDGDIYRVDLRTGRGAAISQGPGTPSLGLKLDGRRLFVAGGTGGDARVVDAVTGALLRSYPLRTGTTFVNDVVLTGGAAWFTDSRAPVLYRLDLSGGGLPAAATTVPITGDLVYGEGNNANGITATPDGRGLVVVQSNTGRLFRVGYDGRSTAIDLGGEDVLNGDGMLLRGRTLYVVQNRDNVITKIDLDRAATRGTVLSRTGDPRFDVPTTVAAYGDRLYLPNARFTTTPTPATPYTAVAVDRP